MGEMTSINKRTIIELSQALEYVVPTLMKNWAGVDKRGLGPLFARFSEIWVANRLIDFDPKIGNDRPSPKKADIYLPKKGKWVEVKARREKLNKDTGIPHWKFLFGDGSQIKKGLFDYCVMVCMDKFAKPVQSYILALDEFENFEQLSRMSKSHREMRYYIIISESIDQYRKLIQVLREKDESWAETDLELKIHRRPSDYLNRWDKIIE